jgi:hypothetical protein
MLAIKSLTGNVSVINPKKLFIENEIGAASQ